MVNIV